MDQKNRKNKKNQLLPLSSSSPFLEDFEDHGKGETEDSELDVFSDVGALEENEDSPSLGLGKEDQGVSVLPPAFLNEWDGEIENVPAVGLGAVSFYDPLKRYIEEMKKYALLDPEEEFRLALAFQNQGDLEAAKRLVTANLRLVVKIAFEYCSYYSSVMDLIQEGNVGLMKAVSKFDVTKGVRLSYYAAWWIRSYILKYVLDSFRLVKIGTTQSQRKLFYHLMREKEKLESQGFAAGPRLLAERLNVREKDVVEMENRLGLGNGGKGEVSLDGSLPSSEGRGISFLELLQSGQEGVDEVLSSHQLLEALRKILPLFEKTLTPKESFVLQKRLLSDEQETLQEIANVYGISRERARQIESKVLFKLKVFFKNWMEKEEA